MCTGDNIVWINWPLPCGQWSDFKIFKHALMDGLETGMKVEAALGFPG